MADLEMEEWCFISWGSLSWDKVTVRAKHG